MLHTFKLANSLCVPRFSRMFETIRPELNSQEDMFPPARKSFKELGLCDELVTALRELNIFKPTAVQELVIPQILQKKSLLFASQEGTGKTLAYLLPVVQMMKDDVDNGVVSVKRSPRAIVLVINGKAGRDILELTKVLGQHLNFTSEFMNGHISNPKERAPKTKANVKDKLADGPIDLLVSTPGKLVNMLRTKNFVYLPEVRYFVVDQMNGMYRHGYFDDLISNIDSVARKQKHHGFIVMAADALKKAVRNFAAKNVKGLAETVSADVLTPVAGVRQEFVLAPLEGKKEPLLEALKTVEARKTIVFTSTIAGCQATGHLLTESGFEVACVHATLPKELRESGLDSFINGEKNVLVTMDAIVWGLELEEVDHIVCFDIPRNTSEYINRVSRVSRPGRKGHATILYLANESRIATQLQSTIQNQIQALAPRPPKNV